MKAILYYQDRPLSFGRCTPNICSTYSRLQISQYALKSAVTRKVLNPPRVESSRHFGTQSATGISAESPISDVRII